jgi:two-component system osmolarity sensor histidine kinase EnvZ
MLFLLVTGQVAALKLFEHFELEPRAKAGALQIISTVNLTRAALLAAHAERRLPLLQELNQSEGIRVYPIDYFEEVEPLPDDPLVKLIAEKVRAELGINTVMAVNHLGLPGVWVSFSIFGDAYWAVIPKVQTSHPFPLQWFEWGAVVSALSLFGAWFLMTRINRPLNVLADAADAIGRGESVTKLPEIGAEEFTRVIHAFNEMVAALAHAEADRNLLLGGVSHDLRTPLARLRLAVEMLPQQADAFKQGMVQDIGDMDAIVGQFLDFVRGAEGEAEVTISLNDLVRDVASRYMRSGKPVQLELGMLPEIKIRRLAIQRMLTNLVDNAFHYGVGSDGKSKVEIHTLRHEAGVILSVRDHGAGLPEAEAERLLRPFERLDPARGREGGAGLGLAIAARIAHLHGGELRLRNHEQGGLEASIKIPMAAQE